MACPTCDHTMQRLTDGITWCPRCGTLKYDGGYFGNHYQPDPDVPKLVNQIIKLIDITKDNAHISLITEIIHQLGITESVQK